MICTKTVNNSLYHLGSQTGNALLSISKNIYNFYKDGLYPTETPQHPTREAIQKSFYKIRKFYVDYSPIPNMFQCILLPYQFFRSYASLSFAMKHRSQESILDNRLRLFNISANSIYSAASLLAITQQLGLLFFKGGKLAFSVAPIVGLITSTICGAIECKNARRQVLFLSKYSKHLKELENNPSYEKGIEFLHTYLGNISQEIDMEKLTHLSNRVKPWYAEKMALEMPELLKELKGIKDPKLQKQKMQEIITLVRNAKIQAQKKLIHQSLTVLCSAIMIAAFATIILMQPETVPFALFVVNMGVLAINQLSYLSSRNQIGWNYHLADCTPSWMRAVTTRIYGCFSRVAEQWQLQYAPKAI